jgi:mono/diheme cytochrome c family protein
MVAVIIVVVVFTGLAATLFYAAPRGKLTPLANALMSQRKGTSTAINVTVGVVIVAFGIVIPAIFLVANHNDTSAGITDHIKLTSAEVTGRTLFGEHCAVCHTLAAAAAVGKTGPNLDEIKPTAGLVEYTIENGCLADPGPGGQGGCLGEGNMPADVVQGADVTDVAKFVAAGHG